MIKAIIKLIKFIGGLIALAVVAFLIFIGGMYVVESSKDGVLSIFDYDIDTSIVQDIDFTEIKDNITESLNFDGLDGIFDSFSSSNCEYITSGQIDALLIEIREEKDIEDSKALLDAMENGENSLKEYYYNQSGGLLTVNTYMLSITLNDETQYLIESGSLDETEVLIFLSENLELSEYSSVSEADFDRNEDGYIDCLMVYSDIAFDEAENAHVTNYSTWSKDYTIASGEESLKFGSVMFLDDGQVKSDGEYICSLICHEFGHVLGFEDYYGTDKTDMYLGGFSLMAETLTTTPVEIGTYLKYTYTDWIGNLEIESITSDADISFSSGEDKVYQIDLAEGVYLWIEQYDISKDYQYMPDASLEGGMLIFLINENNAEYGNYDDNSEIQILHATENPESWLEIIYETNGAVLSNEALSIDVEALLSEAGEKNTSGIETITIECENSTGTKGNVRIYQ
ncbi:MAG: hypothetical protein R3Y32_00150 [Bacillota bacterium]